MLDRLVDLLEAGGWKILLAVALVLIGAKLLRRLLGSRPQDPHRLELQCTCGWSGTVSRYHRTCPKCGQRIS